MSIRLGLIGVGRFGKRYIQTIQGLSGVVLTHLCTRKPENAGLVKNPVEILPDWRKLCVPGKVDGVIIATPPSSHAEILHACLDAGLPTMVEKPICMNLADALKLQEHAHASKVPVLVDHTQLFQPAYAEIKKRASRFPIRFIYSEGLAYGPFRKDVPVLWDRGPHDVALCLDLFQSFPEKIQILGAASRGGAPGFAHMLCLKLGFKGGAEAWIHLGHLSPPKRKSFNVYLENELLVFEDREKDKLCTHPVQWQDCLADNQDPLPSGTVVPLSSDLPLSRAVQEFLDAIQGRFSERMGIDLSVEVTRVLQKAQETLGG